MRGAAAAGVEPVMLISVIFCCVCDAQALLKQEVLNLDAVEGLLGKRPFTNATLQNIDRYRWAGARRHVMAPLPFM
jgi:hypothetical protein